MIGNPNKMADRANFLAAIGATGDAKPVQAWNAERPWHRCPCDRTDLMWFAFVFWRDSIPRPNWSQVADYIELWCGERVPPTRIGSWAKRAFWRGRADALDKAVDVQVDQNRSNYLAEKAQAVGERHLDMLRNLQDLAAESLAKLVEEQEHGSTVLTPREIMRALEQGIKLERLVRGETTDRVETTHDLSKLSDDDLRALSKLQSKLAT